MADVQPPVAAERKTVVPVILANREYRGLWPWSVPERPYPLQARTGMAPPAIALLEAVSAIRTFATPILVVSPRAFPAALELVRRSDAVMPRIVTVPETARSGVPATIAALETAREARHAPMAFLPSTMAVEGGLRSYLEHAARMALSQNQFGHAVMAARKGKISDRGVFFLAGSSVARTTLIRADACTLWSETDEFEIARDTGNLWSPTGPASICAGDLLELVASTDPTLLQACRNALSLGESVNTIVHPQQNFLSLVADSPVGTILASRPEQILLDTAGSGVSVVQNWSDVSETELPQPRTPVVVIGADDVRTIQGPGGLIVLGKGAGPDVAEWFERPHEIADDMAPPPPEVPDIRERDWGSEEMIDLRLGIAILRLVVDPGRTLEAECHVHRNESWVIAAGTGKAQIDGTERKLRSGDHVGLPKGTVHSIRNPGPEPLVIYETRTGAILTDGDRLTPARGLRYVEKPGSEGRKHA